MNKAIKGIIYFIIVLVLLFVFNHFFMRDQNLLTQAILSGAVVFVFTFLYERVCRLIASKRR
jgi:positive regulator of sigma E activity